MYRFEHPYIPLINGHGNPVDKAYNRSALTRFPDGRTVLEHDVNPFFQRNPRTAFTFAVTAVIVRSHGNFFVAGLALLQDPRQHILIDCLICQTGLFIKGMRAVCQIAESMTAAPTVLPDRRILLRIHAVQLLFGGVSLSHHTAVRGNEGLASKLG